MARFSGSFDELAKKMKQRPRTVIRASMLELSGWVIGDTPVGNPKLWKSPAPKGYVGGTARGNWIPSFGSPASRFDENRVAKSRRGVPSFVRKELSEAISKSFGNSFYLTNSTPYIMRLEYQGWSGQAPDGMLRKNVIRMQQAIKNAIAELD